MNTDPVLDTLRESEAPAIAANRPEEVKTGAPPSWVTNREIDLEYRPERQGLTTAILIDHQHHADERISYHRIVQRLETLQAVHQAAQWKLDFDPQTQRPTVHALQIRRGGEVIDHTDPRRFRFLQRETELERLTIHGGMTLVVILEDIRVGDILDISYSIEHTPRLLADRYTALALAPSGSSVRSFNFSVRFSKTRPMRRLAGPENKEPTVQDLGDATQWWWQFDKTAQIDAEQNTPSWHIPQQWIQVSDLASWEEVAARVNEAWTESFDSPLLLDTAKRIAAENPKPLDRAEAALRFVQDDIRYLSHNVEFGGHTPTGPERVLRQRFGDCKDKSFLLAHLLRRLGIPARPVLVHTHLRKRVREFLPMLGAFDHVVVEYEIQAQRRTVDMTSPLQGGGPLRRSVATYGYGLPIAPGVKDLEPLPDSEHFESGYELHEQFYLDTAGGPTLLKIRVRATGQDADNLRAALALEGNENHAQRREQLYKRIFPEVRRVRQIETIDDRGANVIQLSEAYEIIGAVTPTADRKFCAFTYGAHLIQAALALPEGGKRRTPFAIAFPCRLQHDIDIESAGIAAQDSSTRAKKDNAFRFSADTQARSGKISCRYRLQTFEDHVDPERFSHFRRRVEDAARYLVLQAVIPLGIPQPRRRMPAHLLHTQPSIKRPEPALADEAVSAHGTGSLDVSRAAFTNLLPDEPAPPLASLAAAELAIPTAVPDDASSPVRASLPQANQGTRASERQGSRRHRSRSRRSRGRSGRNRLIWGVIACLSFVCLAILIALLLRH